MICDKSDTKENGDTIQFVRTESLGRLQMCGNPLEGQTRRGGQAVCTLQLRSLFSPAWEGRLRACAKRTVWRAESSLRFRMGAQTIGHYYQSGEAFPPRQHNHCQKPPALTAPFRDFVSRNDITNQAREKCKNNKQIRATPPLPGPKKTTHIDPTTFQ